jgi:hypothetical protein
MIGRLNRLALLPVLALASVVAPTAAASAPMIVHAPARLTSSTSNIGKSTNWSGYADTGKKYTKVQASWKEPGATCPSSQHQYSSFWVGLDGYASNSVEQTGTDSDCNGVGKPVYYGWYEMFPAGSVRLSSTSFPVHKSDAMTASVIVTGGTSFTMTLIDHTANWTFTITKSSSTAKKASAEWIAEAPSMCNPTCSVLPLADFGTVKFTATTTTGGGTAGNITTFTSHKIEMISGSTVKALPTTATASGFSDTWHHT